MSIICKDLQGKRSGHTLIYISKDDKQNYPFDFDYWLKSLDFAGLNQSMK